MVSISLISEQELLHFHLCLLVPLYLCVFPLPQWVPWRVFPSSPAYHSSSSSPSPYHRPKHRAFLTDRNKHVEGTVHYSNAAAISQPTSAAQQTKYALVSTPQISSPSSVVQRGRTALLFSLYLATSVSTTQPSIQITRSTLPTRRVSSFRHAVARAAP